MEAEAGEELSPKKTHIPAVVGKSLDGSNRGHLKECAPEG